MAWFTVRTEGGSERSINVAGDAIAAARRVEEQSREPIYCRLYEGIAAYGRIEGEIGDMGYLHPRGCRALGVLPMREVYMDAGYCIVPAGDWIVL